MKIAIITAYSGLNYSIDNPEIIFDNVDYFVFTDSHNISKKTIWNIKKAIPFSSDIAYANRRNAKIYKILPFLFIPNYDYYIWVDITHKIIQDPHIIIKNHLKNHDIAVFKHPDRNCIYKEGNIIRKRKIDFPNLVKNQLNHYKKNYNYPKENGLYELSSYIQRNTDATRQIGLCWWEEICRFSSRDQLSFPFILRHLNITPSILPGKVNIVNGNDMINIRYPEKYPDKFNRNYKQLKKNKTITKIKL